MTDWKYFTPERDGHAPDDWVEGLSRERQLQCISNDNVWKLITQDDVVWAKYVHYRYRPLQDATPDLLAQCLALPQDKREALIEAMQKPQRDWADDVWEKVNAAYLSNNQSGKTSNQVAAAVIRSMCRPKEVGLDSEWLHLMAERVVANYNQYGLLEAAEAIEKIIREALS